MTKDELDTAISFYADHVGKGGMSFVNDATIVATLAFLRELKGQRHPSGMTNQYLDPAVREFFRGIVEGYDYALTVGYPQDYFVKVAVPPEVVEWMRGRVGAEPRAPLTYDEFWKQVGLTGWNPSAAEMKTLLTIVGCRCEKCEYHRIAENRPASHE